MTIKLAFLCLLCCILASCATMFNKSRTNLTIYTENPVTLVYAGDTLTSVSKKRINSVRLTVPRSKDSLEFVLYNDSLERNIKIPPKNSMMYYLNAYPIGLGFLIDHNKPKRYGYSGELFFNNDLEQRRGISSSIIRFHKNAWTKSSPLNTATVAHWYPEQGDWYLNFTFPFIYPSHSTLTPVNYGRDTHFGLLGLALGLDFYYKDSRFIKFAGTASALGDVIIGCVGYDDNYDDERSNVYTLSLSHNHRYKNFSFGYGISYAYNKWWAEKRVTDLDNITYYSLYYNQIYPEYPSVRTLYKDRYSTLGLTFNSYWNPLKGFAVGLIYNPYFFRLKTEGGQRFSYDHLISLDISFKFRLRKGKR